MSAWLCSQEHINLLVNASGDPREEDFNMLVTENIRSLEARYPGRDFLDEWKADAKTFKFERKAPVDIVKESMENYDENRRKALPRVSNAKLVATQIIKSCNCYDYQACETNDYDSTPAAEYVEHVRALYVAPQGSGETAGKLYDALLWGID